MNAVSTYKHSAPLALKTAKGHGKHQLVITHTVYLFPVSGAFISRNTAGSTLMNLRS